MNTALVRASSGIPRILQSRANPSGETRTNRLGDGGGEHTERRYKRSGVLPLSCKQVYDVLSDHASPMGEVTDLSVAVIASRSGLSERAVYRALKRLEAVRLVSVIRSPAGGRGAVNVYRLRPFFAAWLALKRGTLGALGIVLEYARELASKFSTGKGEPIERGIPGEIRKHPEDPPPRIRSPGQILGHLRRVVEGNDSLHPTQRKAILTATGRFLFHEGGFARFQRRPTAARKLVDAYRSPRPARRSMPYRTLYAQMRRWLYELTAIDPKRRADRQAWERRGRLIRAGRRMEGLERWRAGVGRLTFEQLEWFRERQAEIVRSVEAERLSRDEYRALAEQPAWSRAWGIC